MVTDALLDEIREAIREIERRKRKGAVQIEIDPGRPYRLTRTDVKVLPKEEE